MPTGLLIYDGDCGFCTQAARWFDEHSGDTGAIASWQSIDLDRLGLTEAQTSTAVFWSGDGRTHSGIDALNEALRHCGPGWSMLVAVAAQPPIIWLSRLLYPLAAKHRHKFLARTRAQPARDDDGLVIDLRDQPAIADEATSATQQSRQATSK